MKPEKFLQNLIPKIAPELKGHILENSEISLIQLDVPAIRISCKTFDDPARKSKRFTPIKIQLHEDFGTSEFAKRPFGEISKEFSAFIRKKCAEFIPRTTDNPSEPHTEEIWIFPPEC